MAASGNAATVRVRVRVRQEMVRASSPNPGLEGLLLGLERTTGSCLQSVTVSGGLPCVDWLRFTGVLW